MKQRQELKITPLMFRCIINKGMARVCELNYFFSSRNKLGSMVTAIKNPIVGSYFSSVGGCMFRTPKLLGGKYANEYAQETTEVYPISNTSERNS